MFINDNHTLRKNSVNIPCFQIDYKAVSGYALSSSKTKFEIKLFGENFPMRHAASISIVAAVLFTAAFACNFSTANLDSLKVGKNADVTSPNSNFSAGDTVYAVAGVANNPGKVKVKMYIQVENMKGVAPGTVIENSVVDLDMDGDALAKYHYQTISSTAGGTFKIVAEMYDENGEKKDSKSETFTVTPGSSSSDDED